MPMVPDVNKPNQSQSNPHRGHHQAKPNTKPNQSNQSTPPIGRAPPLLPIQSTIHHPRVTDSSPQVPEQVVILSSNSWSQSTHRSRSSGEGSTMSTKPPILPATGTQLHQPQAEPSHGEQGPLSNTRSARCGCHGPPTAPHSSEEGLISMVLPKHRMDDRPYPQESYGPKREPILHQQQQHSLDPPPTNSSPQLMVPC